jgi:hypothetical protein
VIAHLIKLTPLIVEVILIALAGMAVGLLLAAVSVSVTVSASALMIGAAVGRAVVAIAVLGSWERREIALVVRTQTRGTARRPTGHTVLSEEAISTTAPRSGRTSD